MHLKIYKKENVLFIYVQLNMYSIILAIFHTNCDVAFVGY